MLNNFINVKMFYSISIITSLDEFYYLISIIFFGTLQSFFFVQIVFQSSDLPIQLSQIRLAAKYLGILAVNLPHGVLVLTAGARVTVQYLLGTTCFHDPSEKLARLLS